jgi:hypothetical protein
MSEWVRNGFMRRGNLVDLNAVAIELDFVVPSGATEDPMHLDTRRNRRARRACHKTANKADNSAVSNGRSSTSMP